MAEDLVTLGFAFSAGNAETEINKLISAFNTLDEKSQTAQKSLGKLFGGSFVSKIDLARKSIGKFNAGLVQTANFAKKTASAIKPLPTQIGKITTEHLKPIPPEVLQSLSEYSRLVREAADAVSKLNVNAKSVKATPVIELNNAMRDTGRHAEDLGESIYQMFRTGTLAAFFKKSTEMAVAFGVELAHVNSLTLEFDSDRIRSGLLNLSSVYGSATKNAEALYYAYSSGVRGSEADLVHFTQEMAGLSTLIRANVTQTVDAATSAMNAYNLSARDAGQLTDLFYGIVKQGKARGEQLASGLGQVISTAATAGLSLDEMGASIASLTKVMQTRNAITYFNNMLSKMIKPTKECRLAAEKLGIELGLDALRAKGFAGMMQEIHDKTRGSQQAILNLFPDLRGQRAALQLLNKGWGDFQNQLQFFANKSGIADKAMQELTGDIYFQLSKIPDTVGKIKIATGDLMVQILTLGGALTPLITAFNNMGETGQKVVGAMVLIAGGLALVKTSKKIHMAMSLLEMKYNAILSGQRREEVAERTAVAAAITKETAARKGAAAATVGGAGASAAEGAATAAVKKATVVNAAAAMAAKKVADANLLRAKSELVTARNVFNSAAMTLRDAQAKVAGLTASRWNLATQADLNAVIAAQIKVQQAQIRWRIAHKAALDAETKALAANAAVQSAQSATGKTSIFGALSSRQGFVGGFGRDGIKGLLAWKHALRFSSGGGMFASMGKSITMFGTGLGKVAALALKIFTPTNLLIAGAVATIAGLIDVLSSEGNTWSEKVGNSKVVSKVGEAIYDFFTGAITAAKKMEALWATTDELKHDISDLNSWKRGMAMQFATPEIKMIPINEQFKLIQQRFNDAVNALKSEEYRKAQSAVISYGNELEQMSRIAKTTKRDLRASAANQRAAIRAYQQALGFSEEQLQQFYAEIDAADGNYAKMDKTIWDIRRRLAQQFGKNAVIYKAAPLGGEVWQKLESELAKSQDGLESRRQKVQELLDKNKSIVSKTLDFVKQNSDLLRNFYEGMLDAIRSVEGMAKKQRFAMLSPEEQIEEQLKNIRVGEKDYFKAAKMRDAFGVKTAFESVLKNYNEVMKYLDEKIKGFQSFQSNLKNDAFDYLLKATQDLPKKLTLLRSRAAELYRESGGRWIQNAAGQWNFQVPTGVNSDLAKSYEKAKQAAGLQIQALQEEIKAKQKLAQAEKRANDNTVRLIQSMDKFKATTASAVNAYSLEAQQLQSRKFVTPAKVQPVTVAQSGLGNSQNQLNTLYQQLAAMTTAYQTEAAQREAHAQEQRDRLNNGIDDFLSRNERITQDLEKRMKALADTLHSTAETIAKGLNDQKTLNELTQIKKNTARTAEMSVVTY